MDTNETAGAIPDTWHGDAVGLVDAFRNGARSPVEELGATYRAIDASDLNAVCFTDRDAAMAAARDADVGLPFGGVPLGVKELNQVEGWPDTEASVPLRDRIATHTTTQVRRLVELGGAVLAGQTTSSEFGGVNVTRTHLHGVTHNPWQHGRTPGGSSGGSAAAVAGGIFPIATGGDGGGSIRIPAGFTGLVGLKGTFGRIPLGPHHEYGNLTVATGCMARSVRDSARWFDVANGHDPTDPLSLPPVDGWELALGSHGDALRGNRVAVVPDWGGATVSPVMWELLDEAATLLIDDVGMRRVDVDTTLPRMGGAWAISGNLAIRALLGDLWPDCAGDLTSEMSRGLEASEGRYGEESRARIERRRMELNEAMARIFDTHGDGVDFIIAAANPDTAFEAEGPLPSVFGGIEAGARNNGLLTFPANLHGNPAISVPAGTIDGLPFGLQIIGRHFTEPFLLDLALTMERNRPWPLVAPRPSA
jgi:aspartyl-tRNA(Asn)/glutamyl-tRNA(Gln) amidotransferase subunit A